MDRLLRTVLIKAMLAFVVSVQMAFATPFTENVPGTGVALPDEYPAAGGVVIVMTGTNGNIYYQFSDPAGAFRGFQNSGNPAAFRGNPFTINNPIAMDCGFRSCEDYFGGQIARIDVRFSAYDGDTQSGGFDEDDISLMLNGINVGSWSGLQTEITDTAGTSSGGFQTGFGNNTFNTGWFSSTNAALMTAVLNDLETTTQVLDDDPNDNYWDFRRGNSLPDEALRTIAPGYELEKTARGGITSYTTAGEILTYDYVVRNIGSVDISNISVVDDKIGAVSCSPTSLPKTLSGGTAAEATCSATYEVTQEDIEAGTLTNIAEANGDPEFGSLGTLTDTVTLTGPTLVPGVSLDKTANPAAFTAANQNINYTFTITNTGNVTLNTINVTDPLIPALSCSVATLSPVTPNNVATCSGTYTTTQDDVDDFALNGTPLTNTAALTGTAANGAPVTANASESIDGPVAAPAISVVKTALDTSYAAVGDVLDYEIEISNDGNVTWPAAPVVDDPLTGGAICPVGPVAPNTSITCTAQYTVDQDDLDAESVTNTATAEITIAGTILSDGDDAVVDATVTTGLEIVKTLSSGANPYSAITDSLVYSYELTNTGNVTLSGAIVTDDKVAVMCPPGDILPNTSITCTSATYDIDQADIDAGSVTNTASASADTDAGATVNSAETDLTINADQSPELTIAKSAPTIDAADFAAGLSILYTYDVSNTGNTTITSPVNVTDDKIVGPISCGAVPIAPGGSVTCSATYIVTPTDVAAGGVTNIATASDGSTTSDPDSVSIPQVGNPGITLDKTADTATYDDTSDTLSYTFTLRNTGETVISNAQPITINDPLIGAPFTCVEQPVNLFPVGSGSSPTEFSCQRVYGPVSQGDLDNGQVDNTASASFPFTVGGITRNVTSPDSSATVLADLVPDFTLDKSVLAADGNPSFDILGEDVTYTFAITNNGPQVLSSVTITDPLIPTFSCTITNLAVGATDNSTCSVNYPVDQDDLDLGRIDNTASATGTGPTGRTDTQTDTAQILINPAAATRILELEKTSDVPSYAAVGDTITYTMTVRNIGNLTLQDVAVSDTDLGLTCTIGTLAPLGSDNSCTGSRMITQDDIDLGSYVNTATASATGAADDIDDATVTGPTRTASMTFEKSANGPFAAVGDVVTFGFEVTNTGNVTLTDVVVTDPFPFDAPLSCTIAAIAPGTSDSCTADYTVIQSDIDAGQIDNTATVNADGVDGAALPEQTDDATVLGPVENALVRIVKTEADGNTLFGAEGSPETYTFEVFNDGNVTLTGLNISDPLTGLSCALDDLAPGGSTTTCTGGAPLSDDVIITQPHVDAGTLTNTATVTGATTRGTAVNDTDTVTLSGPDQLPMLSIVKSSPSGANFSAVGDTVTYSYLVTNTGNITLTAPITVNDDKTSAICPPLPLAGLPPLGTLTCSASYLVIQDDLNAGQVTNIASASVNQPVVPSPTYPTGLAEVTSLPDTITVDANQLPAIAITKALAPSSPTTYAATTDVITFEFTVQNTGNVSLSNQITVTDALIPVGPIDCPASGPVNVAPGGTVSCTATWSPEQGDIDIGSFTNSATASVDFNGSPVVTPVPGTVTINATQTPQLAIAKSLTSVAGNTFAAGSVVSYSYEVTNPGNTTIIGPISVNDDKIPTVSCPVGNLAPLGSLTCTGSYTLTLTDVENGGVTNIASATNGVTTSPEDSVVIPASQDPSLSIVKSADVSTFSAVGDLITYTYQVTNDSPAYSVPGGLSIRPAMAEPITVSDDKITGAIACTPTGDGQLSPGETATCTATYTITQADLDATMADGSGGTTSAIVTNIATGNATYAGAPVQSDPDTVTVTGAPDPNLMLTKSVTAGPNPAAEGDVLTYTIVVQALANQTIDNIVVTDPMLSSITCTVGGLPAPANLTLAPGQEASCSGEYTVTQDNIDDQSLENIATASGTSPDGTSVETTGSVTHPVADDAPGVTIVKDLVSGDPATAYAAVDDVLQFRMSVTNSGNVTLTSIDVTDSLVAGTCTVGPLAPGDTDNTCLFNYTVLQGDLDNGTISNTGTAIAQPANPGATTVQDDDTLISTGPTAAPTISMTKTADISDFDTLNDPIAYTYVITNTGNVTLTTQPSVTDDKIANVNCAPVPAAGIPPLGTLTCSASYLVTQDDLDAGFVTNNATANMANPFDPSTPLVALADETVNGTRIPALDVDKTADVTTDVAEGDTITYSYRVENTGNVRLTNVILDDQHSAASGIVALTLSPSNTIAAMDPGDVVTLTATYLVTQADIDAASPLTNIVTATGTPPTGVTPPESSDTESVDPEAPAPALIVLKTIPTPPVDPGLGDVVTFEITVENTGNVSLHNVVLSDTLSRANGDLITPAPVPTLNGATDTGIAGAIDVDEIWTYTYSHTLTQDDVDAGGISNTVLAEATDPSGTIPVSDISDNGTGAGSDPTTLDVAEDPLITALKTITSSTIVVNETVTFAITIRNDGNVTLNNVGISSDILTRADSAPLSLASGPDFASADLGSGVGMLLVGETATYTATYVLTQDDIDAGGIENTATATGTPPSGLTVTDITDDDGTGTSDPTVLDIPPSPALSLDKTLASGGPTFDAVGDVLVYQFDVTNEGNVTITNPITITDPLITDAGGSIICDPVPLAPGNSLTCSGSYSVTQDDLNAGSLVNLATASDGAITSNPDTVTTDADQSPALSMTKVADEMDAVDYIIGAIASYTYTVTNAGNVTITNPITITDNRIDTADITCPTFPGAGLLPGADYVCTATYEITSDDVDLGSVTNNAFASDGTTISPTVSETVPADGIPALTTDKALIAVTNPDASPSASLSFDQVGDVLTYEFTVTNTGEISMVRQIDVYDPLISALPIACYIPDASNPDLISGEAVTCQASYTITQDDLNAGLVYNEAYAQTEIGSGPTTITSPPGTETTPVDADPSVEIVKSVATLPVANVGQTLTYTLTLNNTGNQTLTNVTGTDPMLPTLNCVIPSLAPGASDSCSATYDVTQDDVDAGQIINAASVSATTPAGGSVTDDTTLTTNMPAANPGLTLLKSANVDPFGAAGTSVTYGFAVQNTGNVTLFDVVVTDPLEPTYSCSIARLDVGVTDNSCSVVHVVTQDEVDAGQIENTANAAGTDPFDTAIFDSDTITTDGPAPAPSLEATKTATSGGTAVGSITAYILQVENTGNVTLTAPVLTDTMTRRDTTSTALDAPFALVSGDDGDGRFEVGEIWVYQANHTITQADIDAGGFDNTVLAQATDPNDTPVQDVSDDGDDGDGNTSDDVTEFPIVPGPGIEVEKLLVTGGAVVGDVVEFSIIATNTGNVSLSTPVISDTLLRADGGTPDGVVTGPTLTSGGASVDPGQAWTWQYQYTLTQGDVDAGGLTNTATVTASPPSGEDISDVSDNGDDSDGNTTDDPTPMPIALTPMIETIKTVVSTGSAAGEQLVFDVVGTNNGNVTLSGLTITDTMRNADGTALTPDSIVVQSGTDPLALGAAMTWRVTYTLTQADVDSGSILNSANVTGQAPNGANVSDVSDTGSGDGSTPTLAPITQLDAMIATKLAGTATRIAPNLFEITFTMTLSNTGNVTQTGLVLNDDLTAFAAPATLALVNTPVVSGFTTGGANSGYNGTSQTNLVSAGTSLAPGAVGQVILTLRYDTTTGFPSGTNTLSATSDRITTPVTASVTAAPSSDPDVMATKTVFPERATLGQVVTYTLTFSNNASTAEANLTLVDALPAGLLYYDGTATYNGAASPAPTQSGRELRWNSVAMAPGEVITITLQARVTDGGLGNLTNTAYVLDSAGNTLSNTASATLRIPVEAVFECTDIIGKVFDDRNWNGRQDDPNGQVLDAITDQTYYGDKYGLSPQVVDVVENDEPGLPHVRLATVDGTLITTDEYGRFSVPCAALPAGTGSNFTLKLDTRSLPSGYQVTTENPRVIRVTPGTLARINFGAALGNVVDVDLMAAAFVGATAQPSPQLAQGIAQLVNRLADDPSLLRVSYFRQSEARALARERLNTVETLIRNTLRNGQRLSIETSIHRVQ